MKASALVLTHHPADVPGAIARELAARGVALHELRPYAGDVVPRRLEHSALVVMGGPMAADEDDAYPFLAAERRFIAAAVDAGAHVLGVCLGSQLVACATGGSIRRGAALEIGWLSVDRVGDDDLLGLLPRTFTPFQWHGDAIVAPAGARVLARSAVAPVQAFRVGARGLGLQFHLESDAAMIDGMARAFEGELAGAGTTRAALEAATRTHIAEQERLAARFFGAWADVVARA
jgi:GMP synthase (glutamine-hydrolysing)